MGVPRARDRTVLSTTLSNLRWSLKNNTNLNPPESTEPSFWRLRQTEPELGDETEEFEETEETQSVMKVAM